MPKHTAQTRLLCVFGDPVEHSVSPFMHNAVISDKGYNLVYLAFRVKKEELSAALNGVRSLGILGVNLTVPLKEVALSFVDEISQEARAIGAINTVVNRDGKLTGYNTDGQGFVKSIVEETGFEPQGSGVCIIGSGGSARGVAAGLAQAGASSINIVCRNKDKGLRIADTVRKYYPDLEITVSQLDDLDNSHNVFDVDLLINATPVGMHPYIDDMIDIDPDRLSDDTIISDLIYNPQETLFLKTFAERGFKTINGVGMLAHQGALSFKLWTGHMPDVEVMKSAVLDALKGGK